MADVGTLRTMTLRDGRTLAWAEFGDLAGKPVMYFHGFPGSRLEARSAHDAALKAGARILAVDRPGFGRSSPRPGRRIMDWPADVCEWGDALGLERFAALGVSGGGPYAAVCAYRIPDRLTRVAIVCGVGPFDIPHSTEGMMPMNRMLFGLSRYSELFPRLIMAYMARQIRKNPEAARARMSAQMPEVDRQAMERPEMRDAFTASALEALRQGAREAGHESALYARPWGFRLEDIEREVLLYQGELDANVPPAMGRYQASALPNCSAQFYPDEGHLSLALNRVGEVLEALLADPA
jgi:pimeloyl-ACP methyl ester carboxylesterase